MTQSNNSASDAAVRSRTGVSVKWIVGVALGSAAGAALLVSAVSYSSAEAPVLAEGSHLVKTSHKVEKEPIAKPNDAEKATEASESSASRATVYSPAGQSSAYVSGSSTSAGKKQAAKTPQYGKNASANSKLPAKVKKPNMTKGQPPAGAPVEGPINHSE